MLANIALTQNVAYFPVYINQCTGEQDESVFTLIKDKNTDEFLDYSRDSVLLEKDGSYELYFDYSFDPVKIDIGSLGVVRDTFYTRRIWENSGTSGKWMIACDSIANGIITDYYYKGNLRLMGMFKDGFVVDTMRRFYRSGNIKEFVYPYENGSRSITYYQSGQMKTDKNYPKNYYKEYYESGQLSMCNYTYRKLRKNRFINYYDNGNIQSKRVQDRLLKYSVKGILLDEITRKEVAFLARIFEKNRYKRSQKSYKYKWKKYNSKGQLVCETLFRGSGSMYSPIPEEIELVKEYLIDRVLFYKNGVEFKKIETGSRWVDDDLIFEFRLFEKNGINWSEDFMIIEDIYKTWKELCSSLY
jgi:antitoxin component YwqK of YwqJK toxin-antitoxin module